MLLEAITPTTVLATFSEEPLPGVGDINNWSFTSYLPYPIRLIGISVLYPYLGDPLKALITVRGMTSIWYIGRVTTSRGANFRAPPLVWEGGFLGLGGLTKDVLWTQKGPLVKDWGDDTPATVQDVHVYVGASQTEVEVAEVNPYIGKIRLATPIPLMAPGDPDALVTVDYCWMASPIMEMSGLNTEGLVLNKWDRNGRLPRNSRFPMAVVLGKKHRPAPLQIGWRFMGFERAESSLLNAPTTLALNQSTAVDAVPFLTRVQPSTKVSYEAVQAPPQADPVWTLTGVDSGYAEISGENVGTYVLKDDNSGRYDPEGSKLFIARYTQPVDVVDMNPQGVTGYISARFEILDYQLDGVFTGVGFGITGQTFVFMGAVLINGLQHVGLLKDITRPDLAGSWLLGPQATGTIQLPARPDLPVNQIRFNTTEIPTNLAVGSKFQILSGPQSGVYTVRSIVVHSDRTTMITITGTFPANPRMYGNKHPVAVFETPWTGTDTTYRIGIDSPNTTVRVWASGSVTMTSGTPIISVNPNWSSHASDNPAFDVGVTSIVWGSTSFKATNSSRWSFVRYNIVPYSPKYRAASVRMSPFNASDTLGNGFYWSSRFGKTWFDSQQHIRSCDPGQNLALVGDLGFWASGVEPFLTRDTNFDLQVHFSQEFANSGASSVLIVDDCDRVVNFGTLTYLAKNTVGKPYRRLVTSPSVSASGFCLPSEVGWGVIPLNSFTGNTISQMSGEAFTYTGDIDDPEVLDPTVQAGRVFTITLEVDAVVFGADGMAPFYFGADVGRAASLLIRFKEGYLVVTDKSGNIIQESAFDWNDGQPHSYQFVSSGSGEVHILADNRMMGAAIQCSQCPGHYGDFLHDRFVYGTLAGAWKSITQWSNIGYSVTALAETIGRDFRITQTEGQTLAYWKVSPDEAEDCVDDGGRVLTAELAIEDASIGAGGLSSVIIASDVHPTSGHVRIRFGRTGTVPFVALADMTNAVVQSYDFDWTDGEFHTYQVKVSNVGTVSLLIDESIQVPTLTLAQFPGRMSLMTNDLCYFGAMPGTGLTSTVYWHLVSQVVLPSSELVRTVGVFKGGDRSDIDNWELPRADSSTSPNSSSDPTIDIKTVDWTVARDYRLLRTPEWGVTVYIPSIGTPPWHVGVRRGWVNPRTEPSAGWINVEREGLPLSTCGTPWGYGVFGVGASGVSEQTWATNSSWRLFKPQDPHNEYLAPPRMVLNQANVITSGDLKKDQANEIVTIQSLDKRRVSLKPTHLYAQSIYKIIDGTNIITRESWDFDRYAQLVTLKDPIYQPAGGTAEFSSDHANLTVVFLPGKPVTDTYLDSLPLAESSFLLNERTPPFQKNQVCHNLIEDFTATTATTVSLLTASTFALSVARITDQVAQVSFTPDAWTFDPVNQLVTLLPGHTFTGPGTPLTVEFTPRKAYLVEATDPTDGTDYAYHEDPATTFYRDLKFITVDNDGLTGLIASIGENTISVGPSGWLAGVGGDIIYSPTGGGASLGGVGPCHDLYDTGTTVGSSVGSSVFAFSGSRYSETLLSVATARVMFDLRWPDGRVISRWERLFSQPTMQKTSGTLLSASGGNAALGGRLNDATLY